MPINSIPELIAAINNVAGLEAKLEIYDVNGHRFNLVEVYTDKYDENGICFDVERVKYNAD